MVIKWCWFLFGVVDRTIVEILIGVIIDKTPAVLKLFWTILIFIVVEWLVKIGCFIIIITTTNSMLRLIKRVQISRSFCDIKPPPDFVLSLKRSRTIWRMLTWPSVRDLIFNSLRPGGRCVRNDSTSIFIVLPTDFLLTVYILWRLFMSLERIRKQVVYLWSNAVEITLSGNDSLVLVVRRCEEFLSIKLFKGCLPIVGNITGILVSSRFRIKTN